MGCASSQLDLTTNNPKPKVDEYPWLKLPIPMTNAKVSTHHHPFPTQSIRETGWRCNGREVFPQGCIGGINDFYHSGGLPGYNCNEGTGCDFDLCKYCMMYSYYVDKLTQKVEGRWVGVIDQDTTPKPIAFLKFVIVKGIIKGNGLDEKGEFDVNGTEKNGDCKFNK